MSSQLNLCIAMEILPSLILHFRFLKNVSVLLFLNKIDILAEKVNRGRSIKSFADNNSDKFPDYEKFTPSSEFSDFGI